MESKINEKLPINWLLLIGIMLIATNLRAPLTSVSPLLSLISEELGLSLAVSGMLTTIPLLAFAIFSIVAPITERKFGIERVIFASLLVLAVGIIIRSSGNSIGLFAGTILIGIAIAHCNVLIPSLVKRDFMQHSGVVTGLYSVTMNIFGALGSGLTLPLANKLNLGWQGSLRVWAVMCAVALFIWLPQLKNKTIIKISQQATSKKSLFRSSLAWKISLLMGIQSLMFYTIVTWLPKIIDTKDLPVEAAGSLLAILQIVLVPITFFVSVIASRIRNQVNLAVIGTSMLLIGILALWLGNSLTIMYLTMVLLGVGCGSCFSLAMMFFSLRTRSGAEASQLSGMAQSLGYLLASFGPFVIGALFETTNSWTSSFVLLSLLCLVLIYAGISSSKNRFV